MYRLKKYPAHDNSNRGNDYRCIVMTIHHMEDNTNCGNDYRGNIIMATHHKEDIGNNCYSTLCIYLIHEIQILPLISIQGERLPISL